MLLAGARCMYVSIHCGYLFVALRGFCVLFVLFVCFDVCFGFASLVCVVCFPQLWLFMLFLIVWCCLFMLGARLFHTFFCCCCV